MDNWKNIGTIKADGSLASTITSSPQQQANPSLQQPLSSQASFVAGFPSGMAAAGKTW